MNVWEIPRPLHKENAFFKGGITLSVQRPERGNVQCKID